MVPPSPPPTAYWLARLRGQHLRSLLGPRPLENALASELVYREAPTFDGATVHATLGDAPGAIPTPGGSEGLRVALTGAEDGSLAARCSRCLESFGPCLHGGVLAVDLAFSEALRGAVLAGASTVSLAARAPALRQDLYAESRFDGALASWLVPIADGIRLEISATPFDDGEGAAPRTYGDRPAADLRVLSVFARKAGEKKLLSGREIAQGKGFSPRDRRALEHVKDRGATRKAAYATGVEASLTLEAMRRHGGVLRPGFLGRLDFRSEPVRPAVTLDASNPRGGTALTAVWRTEDERTVIGVTDAAFFPGPFPFVWVRGGIVHPVAGDVDLDFARALANAPRLVVPAAKMKEAGSKLIRASFGRGVTVPRRDAFGLPPVETPRIVLRLSGEPLDVTFELVAVYRDRDVSLGFDAIAPAFEEGRDLEVEARARKRFEATLGLLPEDLEGEDEDGDRVPFLDGNLVLRGDRAAAFWQTGAPALAAETDPPFHVELTETLARVRVGAPVLAKVHVALEGHWLNARLAFRAEDLPLELAEIRAALRRKRRWIALKGGNLALITAAVASLVADAEDVLGAGSDEGRLPAHQLGRLERWMEENDGRIDGALEALRQRLRSLAVAPEPIVPRGLVATLRPYQRAGLAWLQFLEALGAGGILADDMGLGKTVTTLAFLLGQKEAAGAQPNLVVCPTSVAPNWLREAERFTPGLVVHLLHGGDRDLRADGPIAQADLVVTTYAILRRDIEALSSFGFRAVVLDEAQAIKNADSATTRAANRLQAGMRLALSGTPLENRLGELWSLASFANPGILGTAHAFETYFERPIASEPKSPLAGILRARMRPFLLRRTKADVLTELPPKTEIDRYVVLPREERKRYDALAHTLRDSVARHVDKRAPGHTYVAVFAALTRLRQMACDPRLVDPNLAATTSAKRAVFLDLVRELVLEGRRALVFSQFVELLTLWRQDLDAEGIPYEYLDGATVNRGDVVARFEEGDAPLFLLSLKAGGSGLNLTAADTVIHCDPWWNPAVEDQATDRAYRIGQDKPVTVLRLIARGTLEEKIVSMKAQKRTLASAVIDDDGAALAGLGEEDLRFLLGDADLGEDNEPDDEDLAKTDVLATATAILDPDYDVLVAQVQRWLRTTGRFETDLAVLVELPVPFANRLAKGEPFPCSRGVADRIRQRLRDW